MTKNYEEMTHEEIIKENIKVQKQTEKLIKLIYIVVILTIIADIILILLKLNII